MPRKTLHPPASCLSLLSTAPGRKQRPRQLHHLPDAAASALTSSPHPARDNQREDCACAHRDMAPTKPATRLSLQSLSSDHPTGTFDAASFNSGFQWPVQVHFFHLGGVASGVY